MFCLIKKIFLTTRLYIEHPKFPLLYEFQKTFKS